MDLKMVLTLHSYCERYQYNYFVENQQFKVMTVELEKDGGKVVEVSTIETMEDWKQFFDIFETYYEHEDFADEKLDEFAEGLPALEEIGIPFRVIYYAGDGNADIYLKTEIPIAIYFRQEEAEDGPERTFSWVAGDYVLQEIQKDKQRLQAEINRLELIEALLTEK